MESNKKEVSRQSIIAIIIVSILFIGTAFVYVLKSKQSNILTLLSTQIKAKEEVLYPIEINEKYGYIDKLGKEVVPPKFDEAQEFSEGLAAVKFGHKWGLLI